MPRKTITQTAAAEAESPMPDEPRLVTFDHQGREYVELDIAPDPAAAPLKRAKRKAKSSRLTR